MLVREQSSENHDYHSHDPQPAPVRKAARPEECNQGRNVYMTAGKRVIGVIIRINPTEQLREPIRCHHSGPYHICGEQGENRQG